MLARTLLLAILTTTSALAGDNVDFEEVPASVRETALRTAPGLDFDAVAVKNDAGRRVYAFEGRGLDNARIIVNVFADGSFDKVEMETEEDALPAAVRATLEKRFPVYEIAFSSALVHSDGAFTYNVFAQAANGAGIEIRFAENGDVISTKDAPSHGVKRPAAEPSPASFTQGPE